MELLFCCHVAESGPRNITNQRGAVTQLMEGSDPRHSTDYTHSTIHAVMTSQLVQCLTPVIEYTSLSSYTSAVETTGLRGPDYSHLPNGVNAKLTQPASSSMSAKAKPPPVFIRCHSC
ncbi:hypothetical protein SNK04_14609 [Fusarium graminearum]